MKNNVLLNSLLVVFVVFMNNSMTHAQGMVVKVPLKQQVEKSSLVVEGKVVAKKSVWNSKKNNIHTINTIEVYKVFKGKPVSIIEIITPGGTIESLNQDVIPSLNLKVNQVGVFTLYDNNISLIPEEISALKKFKPYSSLQGFYKYDLINNTVNNTFSSKQNFKNSFYNELIKLTKKNYIEVASFDRKNIGTKTNKNISSKPPSGITFSPMNIAAGAKEELTISGNGFGGTKGKVEFLDADEGGTDNMGNTIFIEALDSQITTWTNTQIVVEVPSGAGTGIIRVTDDFGVSDVSTDILTIDYAFSNREDSGNAIQVQHTGTSYDGSEIVWTMNADFETNTLAKEAFLRAFEIWRCETDINWTLNGSNTSVNSVAIDQINVITFSTLEEGVLGRCTVISGLCGTDGFAPQVDIEFSNDIDVPATPEIEVWNFSSNPPTSLQYDFESVALHELGHGHILGHVINPNDVMHYSISNGVSLRVLSANNKIAAGIIQSKGTTTPVCSQPLLTDYNGVCNLSLDEETLNNNVSIFPNPTSSKFQIKNESPITIEKADIYDVSGRLISSHDFDNANRFKTINMTNASKGLYFVKIHSNNTSITRKLILE